MTQPNLMHNRTTVVNGDLSTTKNACNSKKNGKKLQTRLIQNKWFIWQMNCLICKRRKSTCSLTRYLILMSLNYDTYKQVLNKEFWRLRELTLLRSTWTGHQLSKTVKEHGPQQILTGSNSRIWCHLSDPSWEWWVALEVHLKPLEVKLQLLRQNQR